MENVRLLRYIAVFALVLFAFSSVSIGAEKLSQDEIDAIIKGIESGDAEAQLRLGMMYVQGQNVKRDNEQAFYWFRKSYEQDNVEAQLWVALAYLEGRGVEKNEAQAFKLMKQIAEKDPSIIKKVYGFEENGKKTYSSAEELIAAAKFFVGYSYFKGKGTKKDYDQAEYWLAKANGSEEIQELAGGILLDVINEKAKQSQTSTASTQPKSSNSNDILEVSIEQLFREYKENTFAANLRYKDQKVRVSGTIIGINEVLDEICIALLDNNKKDLYCYFDKSETDSIIQLKNGQNVIIEGTSNENLILGVTLNNCRVISSIQAQNQNTTSSYQQPAPSTVAVATLSNPRNFDEAKENAVIFLNSIEEVAENLIATDTYNTQDIEVLPADEYREESETVYMRAWYNEKYFMFSNYANSPRPVACFRTYSPEFTFAGGIKVGSSFSDIRYLFGDFGSWNAEQNTLYVNEGSTEVNIHFDSGRINYIEYEYMGAEYTHKMMNLLYLYRDDIRAASVTTDSRLNVRDANGTHGNILFQVTKQNNILFVDTSSPTDGNGNRWCRVRFVYDKSTNTISSVNDGYVMGKYINVEPLGYGDRQSLITVFSK